ncbi:tRNA lysidine(34) synthetase TilS [Hyphomicrobium sp. CS1BSMeth3]|uniref:tRNA lysidine(34) synthetase TilS n=1 Tax=Hyphomicrobium sp. CS1BSMeth3 TaxID=1892844 RepID=UPI000930D0AB|nr:tRNA lysidine(34) synthetase TilS [Hyphomicrobium sp. CS1BSMeth3]
MDPDAPITDDEIRARFEPLLGAPIALAVSGGADSMALMHVAARALELVPPLVPAQHVNRPRLIVLTVDHGLRAGSAEDAAWVVAQAVAAGLRGWLLRWTGEKPTHGIQAAARAARYHLMHEALSEEALPYGAAVRPLLTAHHMEDQAETFLMRLARGSGIDGLSAMRADETLPSSAPAGTALHLHRPLLDLPKSRLVATLREAGLSWREDPSNARDDFERVRIRKALASLAELGVTSAAIARSASRLSRAREAAQHLAAEAGDRAIDWHDGQFGSIAMDVLKNTPDEMAIRLLARLISAFGGHAPAPRLSEIEALAARVRATSERIWPARAATLGGCRLDWRPAGELRVWREAGRAELPRLRLEPGSTGVWDGRFRISAAQDVGGTIDVRALGPARWRALKNEHPELGKLRLPPGAAATLAACIQGEAILAVAGLTVPRSPRITIDFVRSD